MTNQRYEELISIKAVRDYVRPEIDPHYMTLRGWFAYGLQGEIIPHIRLGSGRLMATRGDVIRWLAKHNMLAPGIPVPAPQETGGVGVQ